MSNVAHLLERNMQTRETLSSALNFLFGQLVNKMLIPRFADQYVHSGKVHVDHKDYMIYFKRLGNTGLEIHFHRCSKTVYLRYTKDMYNESMEIIQQFPAPGGAGYSPAFGDPWLWLKLLTAYIETYPVETTVSCAQQENA